MASEPVQQNVYTLKSFDRIPAIVDKISFTACQSRPIIDSGTDTNGVVGQCEFVFFRSQCGHLENSVIEVTSLTGNVHVYVDNTTSPGPFRYSFKDETSSTLKSIEITRAPGDVSPMYIGVKGVATGVNTFTIRVFSNFFSGSTTVAATVAEDAAVDDLVFQPQFTPGATYTILSGNEGTPAPFSIDSSTGAITVNSALDHETNASYALRVSAVNNFAPCQNGIMFVNIAVSDVNDVVPTFVGAPFTANVALNTPANFNVLQVQASDSDGGSLVYSMTVTEVLRRGRRQAADFAIDSATGQITTTAVIDGSTTAYDLTVSATDGTFTGTASVAVSVDACDVCSTGTFVATPCAGGATTVTCSPITTCGAGEFMAADSTPSSNRDCQPCPPDTLQVATSHTLTSCTPHTPCPLGEVVSVAGTATTNPSCVAGTASPTSPTETPTASPTAATTVAPPTNGGVGMGGGGNTGGSPTVNPTTLNTAAPIPAANTAAPITAGVPTTLSPTSPTSAAPTGVLVSDAASSSDSSAEIVWWPALLVLVLLLFVLAAMVLRSRKKVDEKDVAELGAGNPLYGDFKLGAATSTVGHVALLAGAPALGGGDNPLWQAFRRCIAFDDMYYGNPPLALDDDALVDVYSVLQLPAPDSTTLGKLRTLGGRFLGSTFQRNDSSEALYDDVNDFYWSAIADEMVERAIDVMAHRHVYDEATGTVKPDYDAASAADILEQCLSDLSEDYVPAANGFLVPVEGDANLRQLPPSSETMNDNIYEMAGTEAHAELDYALASGATAINYDVANEPQSSEYAMSSADDVMEQQGEDVYSMASGGADVLYDIGGVGSALDTSDADVVYDIGGTTHGGTDSDPAIYDNNPSSHGENEAVYDFGTTIGSTAETDDDVGDQIYDNNPASLLAESHMESDAVYDIGSNCDGYLGLGGSSTDDAMAYNMAATSDASVEADHVYEDGNSAPEGNLDATYHSSNGSDGYVTLPRADPVLVPDDSSPALYDLSSGAELDIHPVATYELAADTTDDAPGLDADIKLRSRSYDNALNDVAL